MGKELTIQMNQFYRPDSRVLAGRDYGLQCRQKINLNNKEDEYETVIIKFDNELLSLNSSFFKGFFGSSVGKYGKDKFYKKFLFSGAEELTSSVIETTVNQILRKGSSLS